MRITFKAMPHVNWLDEAVPISVSLPSSVSPATPGNACFLCKIAHATSIFLLPFGKKGTSADVIVIFALTLDVEIPDLEPAGRSHQRIAYFERLASRGKDCGRRGWSKLGMKRNVDGSRQGPVVAQPQAYMFSTPAQEQLYKTLPTTPRYTKHYKLT
jgi:hypothetical protein